MAKIFGNRRLTILRPPASRPEPNPVPDAPAGGSGAVTVDGMSALEPLARAAQDLPGVKLTGLVVGAALLYAAIRAMFGKRKK
jgi:hypothetical protein